MVAWSEELLARTIDDFERELHASDWLDRGRSDDVVTLGAKALETEAWDPSKTIQADDRTIAALMIKDGPMEWIPWLNHGRPSLGSKW